jgi:hypothetical protein
MIPIPRYGTADEIGVALNGPAMAWAGLSAVHALIMAMAEAIATLR